VVSGLICFRADRFLEKLYRLKQVLSVAKVGEGRQQKFSANKKHGRISGFCIQSDRLLIVAQDYLIYAAAKQSGCEDARNGYYQNSLKAIVKGKSVSPDVVIRVDEAISHFERALTLSPERKEVYEKLRSIYYGLNRYESVRRLESRASQFGVRLTPLRLPE